MEVEPVQGWFLSFTERQLSAKIKCFKEIAIKVLRKQENFQLVLCKEENHRRLKGQCAPLGYGGHEAWNAAEPIACNKHNKNNEWENV